MFQNCLLRIAQTVIAKILPDDRIFVPQLAKIPLGQDPANYLAGFHRPTPISFR